MQISIFMKLFLIKFFFNLLLFNCWKCNENKSLKMKLNHSLFILISSQLPILNKVLQNWFKVVTIFNVSKILYLFYKAFEKETKLRKNNFPKTFKQYQFFVFSLKSFQFGDNFLSMFDQRVHLLANLFHEDVVLQADVLKS